MKSAGVCVSPYNHHHDSYEQRILRRGLLGGYTRDCGVFVLATTIKREDGLVRFIDAPLECYVGLPVFWMKDSWYASLLRRLIDFMSL